MQQYTIHLPVNYNDYRVIEKHVIDGILESVLDQFGGYTLGPVMNGAWKEPSSGKIYAEPMRQLIIASDNKDAVENLAGNIATRLFQMCVYLYDGKTVKFIDRV